MKTIQELYKELLEDDELKEGLVEAANAGRLEDFLGEHGCDATLEEVREFFREMDTEDESLSFDELEQAAGGNAALELAAGGNAAEDFVTGLGNFAATLAGITCIIRSACDKDDEVCKITETGNGPGIGVVKLW